MTVQLITPKRFEDSRGWFSESWNARSFASAGIDVEFCQDNHSLSRAAGTIRGLHFQRAPHAQSKLVRCLRGRIYDVAVDLRRASPTFGAWVAVELSATVGNQLFIPAGYAHGFMTMEPNCEVAYRVDDFYTPEAEGGIQWDDPELNIAWPITDTAPLLSDKDSALPRLGAANFEFAYDGQPLKPLED